MLTAWKNERFSSYSDCSRPAPLWQMPTHGRTTRESFIIPTDRSRAQRALSSPNRTPGDRLRRNETQPRMPPRLRMAPAEPEPLRYESFEITSPGAEETLWNIEGVLNVSLSLTPALQPGPPGAGVFRRRTRGWSTGRTSSSTKFIGASTICRRRCWTKRAS